MQDYHLVYMLVDRIRLARYYKYWLLCQGPLITAIASLTRPDQALFYVRCLPRKSLISCMIIVTIPIVLNNCETLMNNSSFWYTFFRSSWFSTTIFKQKITSLQNLSSNFGCYYFVLFSGTPLLRFWPYFYD